MNPNAANIGIVGGGAAGFFAAIQTAQEVRRLKKKANVFIFEQGGQLLKKVRISGGGRCNVTHHLYDVDKFCTNYPRGNKELISPLLQFQAQDTVNWFKKNGIRIIPEADGRMFPSTNTSETIIKCFIEKSESLGIKILTQHKVEKIFTENKRYSLQFKNQDPITCEQVLLCTGSSRGGYDLAKSLGHQITDLAPSLFSFKIKHPLFKDLSGTSFQKTEVKLFTNTKKSLRQTGPLLITHWGLSGPAILKLSAWGAREMKTSQYKAKLVIDWLSVDAQPLLTQLKMNQGKSNIGNALPPQLTKRFWQNLLSICKIDPEIKWADVNKKQINIVSENLNRFVCNVNGQNRFKDEFVECGGISLKEVNFKTMESKVCPGLHFAGELLDIDGVTGGFNFQNAWTTGWIAANHIAAKSS